MFGPHNPIFTEEDEFVINQLQLELEKMQYEHEIRSVCEFIIAESVSEAKDKLLKATRWLVASVVPLGLGEDDEQLHPQRLAMWAELNHCWEALGLKQKDLMERTLNRDSQQQAPRSPPADILSTDSIHSLIDEFIALCDQLEPYGLVDYEMGLWEEQIVTIFQDCLELLRPQNNSDNQHPDQYQDQHQDQHQDKHQDQDQDQDQD